MKRPGIVKLAWCYECEKRIVECRHQVSDKEALRLAKEKAEKYYAKFK